MQPTLTVCVGLPGSGKTTWAVGQVNKGPIRTIRVNQDEIRQALGWTSWATKSELFDKHIRGRYFVDFVLDDRNQVVNFWRHIGLTCFQVAEGDL